MTASIARSVALLLCVLRFATASILQDRHVINVKATNELELTPHGSNAVDFKSGDSSATHRYLKAKKTDETYIQVREIDRMFERTSPAEVHIKIHNPKPAYEYWYSITIVSEGVYTGVAKFLRVVKDRPGNPLLYSWIPITRGDYQIIVHELATRVHPMLPTIPMADPYVFSVTDKPGVDTRQMILDKINKMRPCPTVELHDLFTTWDGSWIGPDLHGDAAGLRNGWYFLPSREMGCKLEYFTGRDLSLIPEEKSIYILGSSKERGIFLSLVDMILDNNEKEHLNESVIAKCWGRAFVLKHNLKVLYQDWRSNYFQHPGSPPDVLCHNDKVVREGGSTYTDNGLKVWEEIFQDRWTWPSVILMSTGNDFGFNGGYDLHHFVSSLPSTWKGTLFLTDGAFTATGAGRGTVDERETYRARIRELVVSLNDGRVRWINGVGVSQEMRFYGEDGPDHITRSQHFHSHCNSFYRDENAEIQSMKICSNITELLGQLLLGHALGPKHEFIEQTKQSTSYYHSNKEAMYCHACPLELLPFHITPNPDMTCAAGPLHPRTRSEISKAGPELCPEACMSVPVARTAQTQSGVVYERNCPLEYFLPPVSTEVEQMDKMMAEIEEMKQILSPATAEQRAVDVTSPPVIPEINNMDSVMIAEGAESVSSSTFDLWPFNMVFLVMLMICYNSKIRILMRELSSTSNSYRSNAHSFGPKTDPTSSKKLALGAGAFGLLLFLGHFLQRTPKPDVSVTDSVSTLETSNLILNRAAAPPQQGHPIPLQADARVPGLTQSAGLTSNGTENRRPVMSTFFEPVEGGCCGMSEQGHLNLVKAWGEAWQSKGWDTRVFNAADAMRHPDFDRIQNKLIELGINEYDRRCFWRWLAMANDEDEYGGWMSDYDTFPLTLTGEKALDLMKQPGFKSYTLHVPSLLHADHSSWNKMVALMIDHVRPDLDTKYRVSDMVVLMYLRDHYSLEELGVTVWEASVYAGFPYFPSNTQPIIDCDKAKQYLAAHISHASSHNDYMNLHTYPKIEGMTDQDHAEKRAEAGTIMMNDFTQHCLE